MSSLSAFKSWLDAAGASSPAPASADRTADQTSADAGTTSDGQDSSDAFGPDGGQDGPGQEVLLDNTQSSEPDEPGQDAKTLRVDFVNAMSTRLKWRIWDTKKDPNPDFWKPLWNDYLDSQENTGVLPIQDDGSGRGEIVYARADAAQKSTQPVKDSDIIRLYG